MWKRSTGNTLISFELFFPYVYFPIRVTIPTNVNLLLYTQSSVANLYALFVSLNLWNGTVYKVNSVFPDHCHNGVMVKIIIQGYL